MGEAADRRAIFCLFMPWGNTIGDDASRMDDQRRRPKQIANVNLLPLSANWLPEMHFTSRNNGWNIYIYSVWWQCQRQMFSPRLPRQLVKMALGRLIRTRCALWMKFVFAVVSPVAISVAATYKWVINGPKSLALGQKGATDAANELHDEMGKNGRNLPVRNSLSQANHFTPRCTTTNRIGNQKSGNRNPKSEIRKQMPEWEVTNPRLKRA